MMALGGDKAIPIIMALHKAAGGNVEGAQSPKSESPSADDSGGLFDPEMFGVPTGAVAANDALEREYQAARANPMQYGTDVVNRGMIAGLAGAPIDMTNEVLKQFGLGSDKPFGGSESIGSGMESMGMVSPERHMVGELGAGLVDPFSSAATGAKLAHGMMAAVPLITKGERAFNIGKLEIHPPSDNIADVKDANFNYPKVVGNQTLNIQDVMGGVRMTDPKEIERVNNLAKQISSPDGYFSRVIVDGNNHVIEGQHRLEALKQLGADSVPVYKIEDLSDALPTQKMEDAIRGVGKIHSDNVHQLMQHAMETISEEGIQGAKEYNLGPYQKHWEAAINAAEQGKELTPKQNIHPDYIKRAREEINGERMDDDEYYKALNERANLYRIEDALEKYGYKTHGRSNVSSSSYHQKRIENKLDPDMNDDIHQVRISDHVDRHPPLEDEISKHFNINYRSDPANWADISIWPNMTDEEMHSRLSGLLE